MKDIITSQNLDANESEFFARELESIKATTYDKKYPALKATSAIPVSTEAGSGAETITYQQYDQVGIMKIIANYADDLPMADVFGKEFTSKVRSLGGSYGYNIQEIRAAVQAGKPLTARKAAAERRAYDQAVNRIAWFGDAEYNLLGMLNQPNIPAAAVPAGAVSASVPWSGKTPAEILKDMNDAVTRIISTTKGVHSPTDILLPIDQYRIITTTRMADGTDTTIAQFFMQNNPGITIDWVNELSGVSPAPSGGASPTNVMITYEKSPENCTLELPQLFEQLPVQERNLAFVVNTHARIGGVIVYYPLAFDISEGI